ncbi:erythroblast NAD(P)(+)--arginine ADP-ribosyltransferase-like [Mustelus asterias]
MECPIYILFLILSWDAVDPSVSDGASCGDPHTSKHLNMVENSAAFYFSQTEAQDKMAAEVLKTELDRTGLTPIWNSANSSWRGRHLPVPQGLREEHMIAVVAYTHDGNLFKTFNNQTEYIGHIAQYNSRFQLKSFHYLLTVALQKLRDPSGEFHVYRASSIFMFGERGQEMRFGRFASTSLSRAQAEEAFGSATLFTLDTTYGVPIQEYSFFEQEEEVLVPPYEKFEIVSAEGSGGRCNFTLRSRGYEGVEVGLERDASGRLRVHLKSRLPWWAWLLIAIAILVVLVGTGGCIYKVCCQG